MASGLNIDTLPQYLGYPIQAPPPGVTPNFVNPESTAYQVYITAGVAVPLMLALTITRFAARFYTAHKAFIVDDIIFLIGLMFCLIFVSLTIACVAGSVFGRHSWDVLLGSFTKFQLVASLLVEIVAPLALLFIKVSVLILYLRVFSLMKWMRLASLVGIVILVAFHISVAVSFIALCSPKTGTSQLDFLAAFISDSCNKSRPLVAVQGAGSVVSDLYLLILPLLAVAKLQMPLRKKLAVSSMFLIGVAALASSVLGLYYRSLYFAAGGDNIRLVVPTWATTIGEDAAGVIVCCMPASAALFRVLRNPGFSWLSPRTLRSTSAGFHASNNSNFQNNLNRKESDNSESHIYDHPGAAQRHEAWAHSDAETHSLQHLTSEDGTIGKRTDVNVSWHA